MKDLYWQRWFCTLFCQWTGIKRRSTGGLCRFLHTWCTSRTSLPPTNPSLCSVPIRHIQVKCITQTVLIFLCDPVIAGGLLNWHHNYSSIKQFRFFSLVRLSGSCWGLYIFLLLKAQSVFLCVHEWVCSSGRGPEHISGCYGNWAGTPTAASWQVHKPTDRHMNTHYDNCHKALSMILPVFLLNCAGFATEWQGGTGRGD